MFYVAKFHPEQQNVMLAGCGDKKIYQWDMDSGDLVQVRTASFQKVPSAVVQLCRIQMHQKVHQQWCSTPLHRALEVNTSMDAGEAGWLPETSAVGWWAESASPCAHAALLGSAWAQGIGAGRDSKSQQ